MIDGMGIGDRIVDSIIDGEGSEERKKSEGDCSENYIHLLNNMEDAELIVVEPKGRKQAITKDRIGTDWFVDKNGNALEYKAYAIYGNKVVSTRVFERTLNEMRKKGIKFVWANRKPYILNGDLQAISL